MVIIILKTKVIGKKNEKFEKNLVMRLIWFKMK